MKSSALLPALLFCLLSSAEITAQQVRLQPETRTFAIGLAPFSLLLPGGKLNLHGEWAYSGNKSLSLLVSIPRPTPAPGLIGGNFDLADDVAATVNRFTAFGAVLEHRFYLGQNALHGFYLAPYSRYNNISLERTTQNTGSQFKTTVKGAVGGFGFGAAAGVQFRLGDFLTLDATLAGVDFKWLNGTFTYSSDDPETDLAAFRDKVQETVGDLPVIGPKLAAAIEGNAVSVHVPGWVVPAYRFNLTVNYVF
jgi:hypothetical protein